MDVLLMELIRRAESEGGENWLRQCLAAAPSREVEGRSELTRLEDDIEEAVSPAGSSLEVPSSAAAKRMKSAAESSLRVERSSGRSLQVPELERRRPTVSSKKVAHSAGSAQQVPAQLANPLARSLVRERETTGWSGTPSCSKDGVEDTAEAPASLVLEAAQDFSSELQPRKRSRKTRVAYSPPPPVSRRRRGPRSQLSCQQVSPGSTGTQQEVAEVVHDPGQVEQSVAEVQNDGTRSGALWNSVSSSFMESELGLIYVNIQRSLAPRTWADYSAAWKEWVNFCVNENCNFFHNEVGLVLKFVCSLISRRLSFASISKSLAGISFFLKLNSCPAISSLFPVKQLLKGYHRSAPVVERRRPISLDLLLKLFNVLHLVCFSKFEVCLFRTAFVLMFFAALRISELVAESKVSVPGLSFQDVSCKIDHVLLLLKKSKTDQLGKGRLVRINQFSGSVLCPVSNVKHWLSIRLSLGVAFLIHQNGDQLSRFQFNSVLKKCLKSLKLEHLKISSHSFRIGAATEAAQLGIDEGIIKRIGRWESNRFKLYVRPDLLVV
ncbi:uncharacterized protein LOC142659722 isoform X1 [Rhinoderma darwinii]|uniref:uncharacterized protein LOC142659721 isoform X1 n=1 Tax=Rhinoderma darwinii TaxID=43563 RepID=UPI003F681563